MCDYFSNCYSAFDPRRNIFYIIEFTPYAAFKTKSPCSGDGCVRNDFAPYSLPLPPPPPDCYDIILSPLSPSLPYFLPTSLPWRGHRRCHGNFMIFTLRLLGSCRGVTMPRARRDLGFTVLVVMRRRPWKRRGFVFGA